MTYGTPSIEIQWSIHATCRGIGGITATNHTIGSARDATKAMIDWLESRDTTTVIEGVSPSIRVWAVLSSDQVLPGSHEMQSVVQGLPADRLVAYSVDFLRQISKVDNWGGGGGP